MELLKAAWGLNKMAAQESPPRRWRFQFSLKQLIIFYLCVSIALGVAIKGWPYYHAWREMERYLKGDKPDDDMAWGQYFGEMGPAGIWVMKKAIRDPTSSRRHKAVDLAYWFSPRNTLIIPEL